MKKELDLRDRRASASVPHEQRDYSSLLSRRERYNKAVRAMKRYNKNMQDYATRTKGMWLKHLQVPQSEYMKAAQGNNGG